MAERKRLSDTDEYPVDNSKKIKLIQTTTRPLCKYGVKCYRKQPDHLRAYHHPSADKDEDKTDDEDEILPSKPSSSPPVKQQTTTASNSIISLMELSELNDEKLLSQLYQMEFPDDLYEFWKFCGNINKKNPRGKTNQGILFDYLKRIFFTFRCLEKSSQFGISWPI
jgi:hypothetical protein